MPENTGSFEFGTVAVKLESIAAQITRMDVKIDHVVATQSKQGERLAVAEARLAQHSEDLDRIDSKADAQLVREVADRIENKADCDQVAELSKVISGLVEKVQSLEVQQARMWVKLTATTGAGATVGSVLTLLAQHFIGKV